MNRTERIRLAQAKRKARDGMIDIQRAKNARLDEAFLRLRHSNAPGFLDIIGEINDLVGFQLKCDQFAHGEEIVGEKGSEKKCRFCS